MQHQYKIRISYEKYSGYCITLLERRQWWIFTWYNPYLSHRGYWRDIEEYKRQWMEEFGLTDEDVEDLTHG